MPSLKFQREIMLATEQQLNSRGRTWLCSYTIVVFLHFFSSIYCADCVTKGLLNICKHVIYFKLCGHFCEYTIQFFLLFPSDSQCMCLWYSTNSAWNFTMRCDNSHNAHMGKPHNFHFFHMFVMKYSNKQNPWFYSHLVSGCANSLSYWCTILK